jgi:hypothetical protein
VNGAKYFSAKHLPSGTVIGFLQVLVPLASRPRRARCALIERRSNIRPRSGGILLLGRFFPNVNSEGRPGMFAAEIYAAVRRFVFVEGKRRGEAAHVFGARETVVPHK